MGYFSLLLVLIYLDLHKLAMTVAVQTKKSSAVGGRKLCVMFSIKR